MRSLSGSASLSYGVLLSATLIYCILCAAESSETKKGAPGAAELSDKTTTGHNRLDLNSEKKQHEERAGITGPIGPMEKRGDKSENGVIHDQRRGVENGKGADKDLSLGSGDSLKVMPRKDITVPSPMHVQLFFINSTAVNLSWDYPTRDNSDPLPIQFLVQLSHDGDPYVNASRLISETSYVFEGMLFAAYYQFRVLAYFEGVFSAPATTSYFVNGVTAPPGPPVNVKVIVLSPSQVSLQWEEPSSPTPLLYLVYWGEDPANLDRELQVYQSTHVGLQNLKPNSTLYFRLRADISGRLSILSKEASVTMPPEDLPPPIILNHTQSEEWVWLHWKVPSAQARPFPYHITNFTLCYTPTNSTMDSDLCPLITDLCTLTFRPPCKCLMFPGDQRVANVSGLENAPSYVFTLGYKSGAGLISEQTPPLCLSMVQASRLMCFSCSPLSSTQLLLLAQVTGNSPEPLEVIVYNLTGTNQTTTMTTKSILPEGGNITVSDLRPWTAYSFALSLHDLSPLKDLAHCPTNSCRTAESAPSAAPTNLQVTNTTSRSTTVQWTPLPISARNGKLSHYLLKSSCRLEDLCPLAKGEWYSIQYWELCRVSTTILSVSSAEPTIDGVCVFTINNLFPGAYYTFQVAAATRGGGGGPYSLSVNASTPEEVLELPDRILIQVEVEDSCGPCPVPIPNGPCPVPIPDGPCPVPIPDGWCDHNLTVTWLPFFSHQGNATPVTFASNSVLSLSSRLCFVPEGGGEDPVFSSHNYCIWLNSETMILKNEYEIPAELYRPVLNDSSFSSSSSNSLELWLDLKSRLSNGSTLHITSQRRAVKSLCQCSSNVTENGDSKTRDLKIALLSSLIPFSLLTAIIMTISLSGACIYKRWKRTHQSVEFEAASGVALENYRSPSPVPNEYVSMMADMRAGDGRSSSSSQHSFTSSDISSEDSSSNTIATDISSTAPDEEGIESVPLLSHSSNHSKDQQFQSPMRGWWDANNERCVEHSGNQYILPPDATALDARQSPDGCSTSSESIDSNTCLETSNQV